MTDDINETLDTLIKLLETSNMLLEANLEANIRIYDVLGGLLTVAPGGKEVWEGLRSQHAQGLYYFPPFAIGDYGEDDQ